MRITDAQIHLWENKEGPAHHRSGPYLVDDALREMDAAGIEGAVNCPPGWDEGALDYAETAARAHPDRIATMGSVPIDGDRDPSLVDRELGRSGTVGLRFVWMWPQQCAAFAAGEMDWIFDAVASREAALALIIPTTLLAELAATARRFPAARFLIDHLAVGPFSKVPEAMAHIDVLVELAAEPNIAIKATGTPSMATDEFPFRSVHPFLKRLYDAYGADRMFWGTDITRMRISWRDCAAMFTDHLPWLSGEAQQKVMGEALRTWIGWR